MTPTRPSAKPSGATEVWHPVVTGAVNRPWRPERGFAKFLKQNKAAVLIPIAQTATELRAQTT